ncbi:MAG: hypothetical protein R6X35_13995 [Candidatus Krumholzibacteriia bacterium]
MLAPTAAYPGRQVRLPIEDIATIFPPRSGKSFTACCARSMNERVFVLIVRSHPNLPILSAGPRTPETAFDTRKSSDPNSSFTRSKSAFISFGSETSAFMTTHLLPRAAISAAVRSADSVSLTQLIATSAPLEATRSDIALPMPLEPPVTSAFLPWKSFI